MTCCTSAFYLLQHQNRWTEISKTSTKVFQILTCTYHSKVSVLHKESSKKAFWNISYMSEGGFSRSRLNLMHIFRLLRCATSLGYNSHRRHSTHTTQLNVKWMKTLCSVTVTLTTLIHSKSTQQYQAAHRCMTALCAQSMNFWLKPCILLNDKNKLSPTVS